MKRRVVISGLGAVSPIGNDVDTMWDSIKEGKCGIDEITHFDTSEYRVKLAAEVKDLDMEKYLKKREIKFNDRFTTFARIAAMQAMNDSNIDLKNVDKNRFGVIIASGIGGIETIENAQMNMEKRGPSKVSPYFIPMCLINLAAGNVAIDFGLKGHCSSTVTACAAASNAIGEAFHKIRDGYEDLMLAGGSEASITPLAMAGFMSMRALHEGDDKNRASIPFDKDRSGFVMGEGAGVLLLEEYEHAKKRGAKIYAEIVGYGATCDAHHVTAPIDDGSGGARAMASAIEDASINASDVDYINAHGTSTPLNDKTETMAVKSAFGNHAKELKISSTKSNTGHLLGASGAIEAIISIKAIENSFIPPTINYKNQDEDCDLNVVSNKGLNEEVNYAMSNSLGFGGHNASLIFKKADK
ncbi:beta-ketoacyl-ACP synthase II [Anaerofustis stercorihominis]|uniref:3-oxoacyl-[acyl-carrier-protein] synthase 2 n=1 Tax=Anaerofustis stercorihominis TaxID=214853 RepID=A0A3E3DUQ0_9FIRM|nr:beta-ketoacyl-ACP synthase II [Anaerofustis stercorihominis]RGD73010.1 beta-ketoacyl-[acyl-carrier-protein] synthase II [Anaerofustis stercorihominis]